MRAPSATRAALVSVALSAALVGALSLPAVGRAEILERVVAVVNEDAILLSDLRQRAAPFLEQVMAAPDPAEARGELYRQILDQMVDAELIQQAGRRMNVNVSDREVDEAIENVRRQSQLETDRFWEAVRQQGFSREQYRADVQRQLFRLKVVNQRARSRVNITEEEVRNHYDELAVRARRRACANVSHVFIELPDGATAALVGRARAQAASVRAAIESPASFAAATTEVGGGDLGRLCDGDLPEILQREIFGLEAGEIGQPVHGPNGYHIFFVRSREAGDAQIPPYAEVRMNIYREMMEQAMRRQEELFLEELRRSAVIDLRL